MSELSIAGFPASMHRPAQPRGRAVFLHGAFADHTGFEPWQRQFAAAGWEAVAASRRGRLGVPPLDGAGITFADYLADTRAVLDEVGPAVLIGHSLGGLLTQVLAAEGRAQAAILVCSAPPGMLTAQAVALPTFAPRLPLILAGRPFQVPEGGCAKLALNRVPDPEERRRTHARLSPESGLVYRDLMFGRHRPDPARVRCPVLVIGGEEDRLVAPALNRQTADWYGAPLRMYPEHAHWMPGEPGAERVAADMLEWLDANGVRAAA